MQQYTIRRGCVQGGTKCIFGVRFSGAPAASWIADFAKAPQTPAVLAFPSRLTAKEKLPAALPALLRLWQVRGEADRRGG